MKFVLKIITFAQIVLSPGPIPSFSMLNGKCNIEKLGTGPWDEAIHRPVEYLCQREQQQSVPSVCTMPSLPAVASGLSVGCTVQPLCEQGRRRPAARAPSQS